MEKYIVQVVADNSDIFCGNGLRFETQKQAEEYALDLSLRWIAVRKWQVIDTENENKVVSTG